ncbi:MFS transporter [Streptomyces sp. bgisy100]|uniref:MFS transporter n=1 Tax=Streptomyces sp. bgisy100 TaxID=3413783 RepID=UPI003D73BC0D
MKTRHPFRSFLVGATLARLGDDMSGPALLLAGLAATGSASSAAGLLAGLTASAAVGGPVLGALLDRAGRPGHLLAWALVLHAGALAAILTGLGRLPLFALALMAVLAGLLGPALSGGWTAQLPRVLPAARLPRGTALDAMTYDAASLIGPAGAGALAGVAGASSGVLVAAVLICAAFPCAWMLPTGGEPTAPRNPYRPAPRQLLGDVGAGFRALVRTRSLARATVTSVICCAGSGMLITCAPLLGTRSLGSAGLGTALLSVVAAAALTANALLARSPSMLSPDAVLCWSALPLAVGCLLAATGVPALLITAMAVAGLAEGPQLTALFAIRHREAPEPLRGRIFTTGASLKITGFALGAGVAGPLAERSLPGTLVAAAGCHLAAALAFAWITTARRRHSAGSHRSRDTGLAVSPGDRPALRSRS